MEKKRYLKYFLITPIYWLGCIVYNKRYLNGKLFKRDEFSIGWKWILKYWFPQKVLGYAKEIPFPVPRNVNFGNIKNIEFCVDDMRNFHSPGCYFQAINAKLTIGKGTLIGPNCGLITTNHNINNLQEHIEGKEIKIGKNCWIGMNSVILPGVILGEHTIVGAGSIVTKSFEDGNCIIAGNPAKLIRKLED